MAVHGLLAGLLDDVALAAGAMKNAKHFRIEHRAQTPPGWKVRTIVPDRDGSHRVRVAYPPGRRRKGSGHVVQILHPKGERNPCEISRMNPGELLIFGNPDKGHGGHKPGCPCFACQHARKIAAQDKRMPKPIRDVLSRNPLDAYAKKHLSAWIKSQGYTRSEGAEARRKILAVVKDHPDVLESPGARSWAEILRMAGNPDSHRISWSDEMVRRLVEAYNGWRRAGMGHKEALAQTLKDTTAGRGAIAEFKKRVGNPSKLEQQRAARERATRIRAARLNPSDRDRAAAVSAYKRMTDLLAAGKTERSNKLRIQLAKLNKRVGWTMADVAAAAARNPSEFVCERCGKKFTAAQVEAGEYRKHLADHRRKRQTKHRRNPEEIDKAVQLFQSFHGRDPEEIVREHVKATVRLDYAALGDLEYLIVQTPLGDKAKFEFDSDEVKLASSPNGRQLYCIGGNQDISELLDKRSRENDFIDVGEAIEVQYLARKIHGDFRPVSYYHEFGELDGTRPRVMFDNLKKQLFFVGGNYFIDTSKAVSPGIEN